MHQKKEIETVAEFIEQIDEALLRMEHIGGYDYLNEYGRGKYDILKRLQRKLLHISDKKKASEASRSELLFKISAGNVEEAANQIERIKKAHPEDVLNFEVTILSAYHSN